MKTICAFALASQRKQLFVTILLIAAIVTVAFLPAPKNTRIASSTHSDLFAVTENDYLNPLISSAKTVTVLNCAASRLARFAGYDQFTTRLDLDRQAHLVTVTRYAGNLLDLLNVPFKSAEPAFSGEPAIYISEEFSARAFNSETDILGRHLTLHGITYKIAGVTRGFSGLLDGTDLWIPVNGRGSYGSMPSMRLVALLAPGTDRNLVQRELAHCFTTLIHDQGYFEAPGAKLLRMERSIQFREPRLSDASFAALGANILSALSAI